MIEPTGTRQNRSCSVLSFSSRISQGPYLIAPLVLALMSDIDDFDILTFTFGFPGVVWSSSAFVGWGEHIWTGSEGGDGRGLRREEMGIMLVKSKVPSTTPGAEEAVERSVSTQIDYFVPVE